MSGQRKKGKGKASKSKDKEDDGAGAFAVDFSKEEGKDIYIPGRFWGLADDGANKMWKCSVFQSFLIIILILTHLVFSAVAQTATRVTRATRIGMSRSSKLAVKTTAKYSGGMKLFPAATVVTGTRPTRNTGRT